MPHPQKKRPPITSTTSCLEKRTKVKASPVRKMVDEHAWRGRKEEKEPTTGQVVTRLASERGKTSPAWTIQGLGPVSEATVATGGDALRDRRPPKGQSCMSRQLCTTRASQPAGRPVNGRSKVRHSQYRLTRPRHKKETIC